MGKETRDANAEGRPSYKDTLNLLQTGFGTVSYTHLTLPTKA